jgi:polyhydroxybutyrate depolymerase
MTSPGSGDVHRAGHSLAAVVNDPAGRKLWPPHGLRPLLVAVALIVGACGGVEDDVSPAVSTPASSVPTLTAVPSPPAPGTYALALDHDGETRSYLLHVPGSYDRSARPPLVLAFHGRPSTPHEIELLSGLSEKADREGFVVAYPDGVGGRFRSGFNVRSGDVDDVGFAGAIIDEIEHTWGTDPDRVYATGFSNGAQMVYRLAAELGDRLAAVAPVSGAPADPARIAPATPVSLITFTGTADSVAAPAEAGLNTWRQQAGCSDPAVRTQDDSTVEITAAVCADGTDVVWYSIADMGHFWPGADQGVSADPTAPVVATDLIWDFFDQHPRAGGDP